MISCFGWLEVGPCWGSLCNPLPPQAVFRVHVKCTHGISVVLLCVLLLFPHIFFQTVADGFNISEVDTCRVEWVQVMFGIKLGVGGLVWVWWRLGLVVVVVAILFGFGLWFVCSHIHTGVGFGYVKNSPVVVWRKIWWGMRMKCWTEWRWCCVGPCDISASFGWLLPL